MALLKDKKPLKAFQKKKKKVLCIIDG